MKIVFLGTYVPKEYEYKFNTISAAANQYQNNLITSLKRNNGVVSLSYITAPNVNPSPEEEKKCEDQGCFLFLAKRDGLKAFFAFRKELKKRLREADCVVTYNMVYAWFSVGCLCRKLGKKSIIILADYTPIEEERKLTKKIYSFIAKENFRQFERAIILSEGSRKYFGKNTEIRVMNGAIDWKQFKDISPIQDDGIRTITYTGWIGSVTGVDLLLEAFNRIEDENIRLIICGQGDELDDMIYTYCQNDRRIVYKGYISKAEYFREIEKADVLINPRNMKLMQNQNNFPSKILEYIAAGRPIVSTRFIGYEEYNDNCLFVDSTIEAIVEGIKETLLLKEEELKCIYKVNRKKAESLDWDNCIYRMLK